MITDKRKVSHPRTPGRRPRRWDRARAQWGNEGLHSLGTVARHVGAAARGLRAGRGQTPPHERTEEAAASPGHRTRADPTGHQRSEEVSKQGDSLTRFLAPQSALRERRLPPPLLRMLRTMGGHVATAPKEPDIWPSHAPLHWGGGHRAPPHSLTAPSAPPPWAAPRRLSPPQTFPC